MVAFPLQLQSVCEQVAVQVTWFVPLLEHTLAYTVIVVYSKQTFLSII